MNKKQYYSEEEKMKNIEYYNGLSEKHRRYFLGMEYKRLGRGSQRYLAEFFKCSRQTIVNGVKELEDPNHIIDYTRQRRPGGGRKKKRSSSSF